MMQALLNDASQTFINNLKQRPDVLGIILFGSWARGNNRPDSDVDLLVILTDGFKRAVEYLDSQAFEIIYTTAPSTVEFWESSKDECARFWEIAKILFDRDGTIQQLQTQADHIIKAGKPALDADQLARFQFDAEDGLRSIQHILLTDPTSANLLLTNKIFVLTELFFDVRQLWIPAPKQRLAEIKSIAPEFYALLEKFFAEETPITERINLAQQMIPLVLNASN